MEAFWNDPIAQSNAQRAALNSSASFGPKLEALFDQYAATEGNDDNNTWGIDATLAWCGDLGVSLEDPVFALSGNDVQGERNGLIHSSGLGQCMEIGEKGLDSDAEDAYRFSAF